MFEFGDIIVIGMFVGVGLFRYGDYIEVWIEGIGKVEFDVLVEDLILCWLFFFVYDFCWNLFYFFFFVFDDEDVVFIGYFNVIEFDVLNVFLGFVVVEGFVVFYFFEVFFGEDVNVDIFVCFDVVVENWVFGKVVGVVVCEVFFLFVVEVFIVVDCVVNVEVYCKDED